MAAAEKSFQEIKELIKERVSLSEIVAKHAKLEKTANGFKARCPLPGHSEKTPSFHVNTKENYFYCYGCHKGGDVFSFLEQVEGLPFFEALKDLAESLDLELPKSKTFNNKAFQKTKDKREKAQQLLGRVASYYQENLHKAGARSQIVAYLKQRGLNEELIKRFGLGWVSKEQSCLHHKLRNSPYFELAAELGVLVKGGSSRDFFIERFMIPIEDYKGKVLGFSGRTLSQKKEIPKYKNSTESFLFKKKEIVYGLNRVQRQIRDCGFVCLVEGFFDQWALEKLNIPAVAIMGTAVCEEQLRLLERFTKQVVLVLDADEAGKKSIIRSLPLFYKRQWQAKVFPLPEGAKDPDEWLQAHADWGHEEVKKLLMAAPEALLWWAKEISSQARAQGKSRIQWLADMREPWMLAQTAIEKTVLADELSKELGLGAEEIRAALSEDVGRSTKKKPQVLAPGSGEGGQKIRSRTMPREAALGPIEKLCEKLINWWIVHWEELSPQDNKAWEERERLFQETLLEGLVKRLGAEWFRAGAKLSREYVRAFADNEEFNELIRSWLLKAFVSTGAQVAMDKAKVLKSFEEFSKSLEQEKIKRKISLLQVKIRQSHKDTPDLAGDLQELQQLRISLEKSK